VRSADGGTRRYELSRRGFLRAGALVAIAAPLAACTSPPPTPAPDPLQPLLTAATNDAATAKTAATAFPKDGQTLAVLGAVRQQQADALRAEVTRAAGGVPTTSSVPSAAPPRQGVESTVIAELTRGLVTAQHEAASLVATSPRYRAGLVGSVAAGCASLAEALDSAPITVTSATAAGSSPSGGVATLNGSGPASASTEASGSPSGVVGAGSGGGSTAGSTLATDTASALQNALAAQNAAWWLYGTASAFAGGGVEPEIVAAMNAVQDLRDATAQRLTSGQVAPMPAQPAYLVPTPVTNESSALAALAIAESGATVAWRSVLEHTDDGDLRRAALAALVDSAVRQTRWRRLSGQSPASVAMPGEST
jgi:hypothetical protein